MATLRNKRKLAAVTREIQDENPRNGQSRNTSVPRINEDYLTQLSEEIEGRITKKLSREFSRIESRISDALSKLDEVLSNQQIQTHSKTVPGTFRNTNVENQGTNEDDSQSDPHPEGGLFRSQTTQNSGPEAGHYMVTGATGEIRDCRDKTIEKDKLWSSKKLRQAVQPAKFVQQHSKRNRKAKANRKKWSDRFFSGKCGNALMKDTRFATFMQTKGL